MGEKCLINKEYIDISGFPGRSVEKNPPAKQEMWV